MMIALFVSYIQIFYQWLNIDIEASAGDLWGLLSVLILLILSLKNFLSSSSVPEDKIAEVSKPEAVVEEVLWADRLRRGLGKTRQAVWGKFNLIIGGQALTKEKIDELEEILFSADIGPQLVSEITKHLESKIGKEEVHLPQLKEYLYTLLEGRMGPIQDQVQEGFYHFDSTQGKKSPQVVMVVGVNGAGKTTTIGKLATKLTAQGANVVVGACDTFRAAAVDQLQVWCERAGAKMVRAKEGADPSGVAFEALQFAKDNQADYCIIDTAGRLHTKTNLMEELKKSKRVLQKIEGSAPHQVLLVIDAITGQNALKQAREFHQALGLTGLVFTKCDGTSKAGNAVSIVQDLKIPIIYIGVGEGVEDLDRFSLNQYLKAMLDIA